MEWWTDPRIWAAIVIVLQFGFVAAHWLGRKSFATTDDLLGVNKVLQDQVDDGEKQIREAHHKIELLEQRIKSLPDFEDIDKLRSSVGQLDKNVSSMASELKGIEHKVDRTDAAVTRIEQHLLGRAA